MSAYRVAADVGGTFTDLVVFNEETGDISITKVPSVPSNPAQCIVDGLRAARVPIEEMTLFSHGTTVGTNALITRQFPRTGLVATKGFRDVLEIGRSTKPDLWDAYKDVAPPYVRRRDRLEVEERIAYDGQVIAPLNEDQAREVARIFKKRGIKSVAVCFINSYVNPIHEQRMRQILEQELPGIPITISSDINPEIFEAERMSTTVVNAVLSPVIGSYMNDLARRLREMGYDNEVLVLHSGGGVMSAETAGQYAARLAASGLAGGAVAMAHIAKICGYNNAIGLDMGGTSADISLMWNGELRITKDWYVEYGYPIRFPSIEVVTIGAGGGSIAWIDEGGSLRNGPQSAGAEPGPACYGKGGSEPTNTDANLILGRLGDSLLGGAMKLDIESAIKAVDKIAKRLNMDTVEAADAIIRVANANMCDALRLISIQKGYDPRDFALVVFGGAGPLHGAYLAQEMNIPVVIVPPYPGVASAIGCLLVDIKHDISKTVVVPATEDGLQSLEKEFLGMEAELRNRLHKEGVDDQDIQIIRYVDMRYFGQWRHLSVPYQQNVGDLLRAFHDEHQREFAYSRPEQPVEIFGIRVTAVGRIPKPTLTKYRVDSTAKAEPRQVRPVYFAEMGRFVDTPVFHREDLPAGFKFAGPAIVEQMDATTVVPPAIEAEVDAYRNIIMHVVR